MALSRIAADGSRLSDQIARVLVNEITSGKFAPGEVFKEAQLAARFRTSRTPVREALQQLEREGVLEIIPRVGARLPRFTPDDVHDLYDLRIALESHALRRLRPTPEAIAALRQILAGMRDAVRRGRTSEIVEQDLNFHEELCRIAGNSRLLKMWRSMREQARALYFFMLGKLQLELNDLTDSHVSILDALAAGDGERSAQLLSEHIRRTQVRLEALLQQELIPAGLGEGGERA